MFLKNEDIHLLIKMENIIGLNEKTIFGEDKSKKIEIDGLEISYYDFVDYVNLISRILDNKKKLSNKANAYNKAHPEKHRESAKKYRNTKKGKKKRAEYQKEYYQKNKKRIAEYRRKHYHENQATREYHKKYQHEHYLQKKK